MLSNMHDGKVWITDWQDCRHEMTPEGLLARIREDSKSDWNWLAPATEIVKTISDPEFPEPIANELKAIILKCFASILLSDISGTEKPTDQIAVAYCYYSLHGKVGKHAKRIYRRNIIKAAMRDINLWRYNHHGEQYDEFCRHWEKDALQHFTERFGIDFMRFKHNIKDAFRSDLKAAEEAGAFKEDEATREKSRKALAEALINL